MVLLHCFLCHFIGSLLDSGAVSSNQAHLCQTSREASWMMALIGWMFYFEGSKTDKQQLQLLQQQEQQHQQQPQQQQQEKQHPQQQQQFQQHQQQWQQQYQHQQQQHKQLSTVMVKIILKDDLSRAQNVTKLHRNVHLISI